MSIRPPFLTKFRLFFCFVFLSCVVWRSLYLGSTHCTTELLRHSRFPICKSNLDPLVDSLSHLTTPPPLHTLPACLLQQYYESWCLQCSLLTLFITTCSLSASPLPPLRPRRPRPPLDPSQRPHIPWWFLELKRARHVAHTLTHNSSNNNRLGGININPLPTKMPPHLRLRQPHLHPLHAPPARRCLAVTREVAPGPTSTRWPSCGAPSTKIRCPAPP